MPATNRPGPSIVFVDHAQRNSNDHRVDDAAQLKHVRQCLHNQVTEE